MPHKVSDTVFNFSVIRILIDDVSIKSYYIDKPYINNMVFNNYAVFISTWNIKFLFTSHFILIPEGL